MLRNKNRSLSFGEKKRIFSVTFWFRPTRSVRGTQKHSIVLDVTNSPFVAPKPYVRVRFLSDAPRFLILRLIAEFVGISSVSGKPLRIVASYSWVLWHPSSVHLHPLLVDIWTLGPTGRAHWQVRLTRSGLGADIASDVYLCLVVRSTSKGCRLARESGYDKSP